MSDRTTIYIVDDDQAMRDSLRWLIESMDMRVVTYASAREFLESYEPTQTGCLILDVRMPEMSGLELQKQLISRGITIPIIFITAHGTVPSAVRALQSGAIDFITKPFDHNTLLGRIEQCIEKEKKLRTRRIQHDEIVRRIDLLTPREREVMQLVVEGKLNKIIAAELNISSKTVEAHRANMMDKMQADSLAELMRMVLTHNEPAQ